MINPVGMLRQSDVYMIKLCGSGIHNIKEIKGTTVNPKSSKYMYIDKPELENMHKKWYDNPKISKSGNSTQ